jgi:hypothetical protein
MGFSRDAGAHHVGDARGYRNDHYVVALSTNDNAGAAIMACFVDYAARARYRRGNFLFIGAGIISFHRRTAKKQRHRFSR